VGVDVEAYITLELADETGTGYGTIIQSSPARILYNDGDPYEVSIDLVFPATNINIDDRMIVKLYLNNLDSTSRTVEWATENGYYSYVITSVGVVAGSSGTSGTSGSSGTSGISGLSGNTGSWTVTPGTNNYSFTVDINNTYNLWALGNIPNGIIVYNATVSVSNSNVPVIGVQYAWNYTGAGNPILFTSIPSQIIGTAGAISTDSPTVGTSTNTFVFGIQNTTGSNVTVNYGYLKIS
jgi:hypothetical protein